MDTSPAHTIHLDIIKPTDLPGLLALIARIIDSQQHTLVSGWAISGTSNGGTDWSEIIASADIA